MNKLFFLISLMVSLVLPLAAQSSLEAVLKAVENNNLHLSTERQFWDAEKMRVKMGLTLPNPTIEGEYLIGSPETAGNQIDISALQAFDLPVAYKRQRELATARADLSVSEVATIRQEVLLKAKLTCLELTYLFQLNMQYDQRRETLVTIQEDFRQRLETGEGNILDVNKVGLQLLELRQRQQKNDLQIQQLRIQLTELNGGQPIEYRDSIYPLLPDIVEFAQIEQASEVGDPRRQTLEQQGVIAEKQLEVSKLYRLPSFEAGYRYQSILGQRFNGIHVGVSIPVWEQKYRTETRQAQVLLADLELAQFANEHYNEIKELYDRQTMLNQSLKEYRQAIQLVDNGRLLDKALRLGEITTIEYFLETSLYENARLHALRLEYEYQAVIAELTKSSLL